MTDKHIKRHGGYLLRAWSRDYYASFEVFRLIDLSPDSRLMAGKGSVHPHEKPTENCDEAETIAHGDVKFDGCTNFIVQEGDDTYAHTCSLGGFAELLAAVAEARRFAASLMDASFPVNEEYRDDAK